MSIPKIFAAGLATVLLIAALLYSQRPPESLRVSGFIESHEIRVGSRVGGRVTQVLVDEGQPVLAGDPLIVLDSFDLLERKAEAEALVRQRIEVYHKLKSGSRPEEIAAAEAEVKQQQALVDKLIAGPRQEEIDAGAAQLALANAEFERASQQHQRTAGLIAGGGATREQLEEAERQLKVTRQRVQVATEELTLLKKGTRAEDIAAARAQLEQAQAALDLARNGFRAEDVAEAEAAVDAARASLGVIDAQLKELTIVSPVNGLVEATDLRPGDLVGANAPAVAISETDNLWVRAYVPENRLNLAIGQELPISVDSFPGETFAGRISFVARQAEFTPGNVQTPEERSKQVFRIKVELTSGLDKLRPGMSADVWLEGSAPH